MREITEKKAALAKALGDYSGEEVYVDDVIKLSEKKHDERHAEFNRK